MAEPAWKPYRVALTNTNEQTVRAAVTGRRLLVHGICGSNAGAALTTVTFKDGASGDAKYTFAMAANGGGFAIEFKKPWPLTDHRALAVIQSASVESYVTAMVELETV
jgi:hypothetical protein